MWPLILALVMVIAVLCLMFPRIEYEVNILRKARFDQLNSRGTIHKRIIKNGLVNLGHEIKNAKTRIQELNSQKTNLAFEEKKELEKTLTSIIVYNQLDHTPGIGPVLKQRILNSCYDGTLQSLRRASSVRGVGKQKYAAILQWVNYNISTLPRQLERDFSGKNAIIRRYSESEKNIMREMEKVGAALDKMTTLKERSKAELAKLKPVSTFTFLKAYKGNREAAEKVTQYLLGAFPEWSKIPLWFETLASKCGTA